jgi:hypothetical protein
LGQEEWADAASELAGRGELVKPGNDEIEMGERYERWLRLRAGLDMLADDV